MSLVERMPAPIDPRDSVRVLRGVGRQRADVLRRAGIESVRDLLEYIPFRYEDRRRVTPIVALNPEMPYALIRGEVVGLRNRVTRVQRITLLEATIDDGTASIPVVWFNQPYIADRVAKGDIVVLFGRPKVGFGGEFQFDAADWEVVAHDEKGELEGRIVPVYTQLGGLPQRWLRGLIAEALPAAERVEDPIPEALLRGLGLPGLGEAIRELHAPTCFEAAMAEGPGSALRRMVFDEFLAFQLAIRARRALMEQEPKPRRIVIDDDVRAEVRRTLPFRLTPAQKRVLREIADDMRSDRPMYRLLQGDVGSGKTIVALVAALVAIANGNQVALLAPTEVLAEQHFRRIRQLVDGRAGEVVRLSGSMSAGEKSEARRAIESGAARLVVGTHALVEDAVRFRSLALAIVDEQHRFGVEQRKALFEKGKLVDVLVMTATPIPRSLALAIHGDLDLSVIDELPPGRSPVTTVVRGSARFPKVIEFVRARTGEGEQAYVVYPAIEDSDRSDVKALTAGFDVIRRMIPERRVAMLHGRMAAEAKQSTMEAFARGEIDVLVSTTVIEVGIDVAGATVMVVVDADRFGLSQLHQLRGRIGRGTGKSYCVLLRDEHAGEDAKARLREFAATGDGFRVAELDLAQRGAGDMAGTRQAGSGRFRFGDIVRDHALMEAARDAAIALVAENGAKAALDLASRIDRRQAAVERVD